MSKRQPTAKPAARAKTKAAGASKAATAAAAKAAKAAAKKAAAAAPPQPPAQLAPEDDVTWLPALRSTALEAGVDAWQMGSPLGSPGMASHPCGSHLLLPDMPGSLGMLDQQPFNSALGGAVLPSVEAGGQLDGDGDGSGSGSGSGSGEMAVTTAVAQHALIGGGSGGAGAGDLMPAAGSTPGGMLRGASSLWHEELLLEVAPGAAAEHGLMGGAGMGGGAPGEGGLAAHTPVGWLPEGGCSDAPAAPLGGGLQQLPPALGGACLSGLTDPLPPNLLPNWGAGEGRALARSPSCAQYPGGLLQRPIQQVSPSMGVHVTVEQMVGYPGSSHGVMGSSMPPLGLHSLKAMTGEGPPLPAGPPPRPPVQLADILRRVVAQGSPHTCTHHTARGSRPCTCNCLQLLVRLLQCPCTL